MCKRQIKVLALGFLGIVALMGAEFANRMFEKSAAKVRDKLEERERKERG